MAKPLNAPWQAQTIADSDLNLTTYGNGTTAVRNAITSWENTRLFFDTDTRTLYYNSHASAPSSVTWTEIPSGYPLSSIPVKANFGVGRMLSFSDITTQPHYITASNPDKMSSINGNTADYFRDDFTSYTSDANFAVTYPTSDTARVEGKAATDDINVSILDADGLQSDQMNSDPMGTTISDSKWYLRFEFDITTFTVGTTSETDVYIGFNNIAATVRTQNSDVIVFGIQADDGVAKLGTSDKEGGSLNAALDHLFTRSATAELLFVELIRTSTTTYECHLSSTSAYTRDLESITGLAVTAGTAALRYFKVFVGSQGASSNADIVGDIKNIEFMDGVTALP